MKQKKLWMIAAAMMVGTMTVPMVPAAVYAQEEAGQEVDGTSLYQLVKECNSLVLADTDAFKDADVIVMTAPLVLPENTELDLSGKTLMFRMTSASYAYAVGMKSGSVLKNGSICVDVQEGFNAIKYYGIVMFGPSAIGDRSSYTLDQVEIMAKGSENTDWTQDPDHAEGLSTLLYAGVRIQGVCNDVQVNGCRIIGNYGIGSYGKMISESGYCGNQIHVKDSTVSGYWQGISQNGTYKPVEITVSGTSVIEGKYKNSTGIYVSNGATEEEYNASSENRQKLTIEGPVTVSGGSAVVGKGTEIVISENEDGSPEINGTAEFEYVENTNGPGVAGAAVVLSKNGADTPALGSITITGGEFSGLITSILPVVEEGEEQDQSFGPDTCSDETTKQENKPVITISGGKFAADCFAGVDASVEVKDIEYFTEDVKDTLPEGTVEDLVQENIQIDLDSEPEPEPDPQPEPEPDRPQNSGTSSNRPANGLVVSGQTVYVYKNGQKVKSAFLTADGKTVYADADGKAVTGFQSIDGSTYYFDADYSMQTGLVSIDNDVYDFGTDGVMQIGWKTIGSNTYYFDPVSGKALKGSVELDGKLYQFNDDGTLVKEFVTDGWKQDGSDWYYRKDGVLLTGMHTLEWNHTKHQYYFEDDGKMHTGWKWMEDTTGSGWYFFDHSGAMKTGWLYLNTEWYFMGSDGQLQTGWLNDAGTTYYLTISGPMAKGWKWINDEWYFFDHSGAMKTGWLLDGSNWYYLNADGTMAKSTLIGIYQLDSSGRCLNPLDE